MTRKQLRDNDLGIREVRTIQEEQVCVDSLCRYLLQDCHCREVVARPEKRDPPDYWVEVDGIEYATEVTSIVTNQAFRAQQMRLKEDIRAAAVEDNVLDGSYHLDFHGRFRLPRRGSPQWKVLVRSAVEAICSLKTPLEEQLIRADGESLLMLVKGSNSKPAIGCGGPVDCRWAGEARDELQRLMQEPIDKKRQKLKRICGSPVILVLYDAYGFADADDAQTALLRTNGYDWFYSIFWAASFTDTQNVLFPDQPGRKGTFLYSEHPTWRMSPT